MVGAQPVIIVADVRLEDGAVGNLVFLYDEMRAGVTQFVD